jgi:hypothetical protein
MKYLIKFVFYFCISSIFLYIYNPFSINYLYLSLAAITYEIIFNNLKFKLKPWIVMFLFYFLISKLNFNFELLNFQKIEFNKNIFLIIITTLLLILGLVLSFGMHFSVIKYIKKDTRIIKNIFTGKKYIQIYDDGWDSKFDYKYYKHFQ